MANDKPRAPYAEAVTVPVLRTADDPILDLDAIDWTTAEPVVSVRRAPFIAFIPCPRAESTIEPRPLFVDAAPTSLGPPCAADRDILRRQLGGAKAVLARLLAERGPQTAGEASAALGIKSAGPLLRELVSEGRAVAHPTSRPPGQGGRRPLIYQHRAV